MITVFVQDPVSVFSPASAFPGSEALPFQAMDCAVIGGRLMSLLLNQYEIAQQEKYVAHCRTLHIRQDTEKKEPLGSEN